MSFSGVVADAPLTEGVTGRRVVAWLVDAVIVGLTIGLLHVALWFLGFLTLGLGWFLIGGLWVLPLAYIFVFDARPGATRADSGERCRSLTADTGTGAGLCSVLCGDDVGRRHLADRGVLHPAGTLPARHRRRRSGAAHGGGAAGAGVAGAPGAIRGALS